MVGIWAGLGGNVLRAVYLICQQCLCVTVFQRVMVMLCDYVLPPHQGTVKKCGGCKGSGVEVRRCC